MRFEFCHIRCHSIGILYLGRKIKPHATGDAISSIGVVLDDFVLGNAQFGGDAIDAFSRTGVIVIEFMPSDGGLRQIGLRLSQQCG